MNKNLTSIIFIFILICLGLSVYLVYNINQPQEVEEEKELVYIETQLGCLPTQEYTNSEWEAKNKLLGDYNDVRCYDG